MTELPPAVALILGGCLAAWARGRLRAAVALIAPLAGLGLLLLAPSGEHVQFDAFGYTLTAYRVDALSRIFGVIFHIAAFIGVLFALHSQSRVELSSGLIYAGSSIGAVFAGDLVTLFIFWELVAVASTFQILARSSGESRASAFRYLMVQLISGLLLLVGLALFGAGTGSMDFGAMSLDATPGAWFIFFAFGLKCGWPLLHGWIVDGYPRATPGGCVFLSAFTTKLAVYALARGFPGAEPLIWIGLVMALFPIFYAVIENDLRRVLCYSMINQIGYMVCGIGIGTELALNGVAAHAFCHILYKALLFMAMGAVLHRTGRIGGTDLGGLHRTMPWTTGLCCVGAASISAFPLTSGFISKSMIMSAAAAEGYTAVWLGLLFAAAGVFHHAGIKIPFFAFFQHDSGLRPKEAPWNMLAAMGIAAAFCIGLGVFPDALYSHLPYAVDYLPYTLTHVITQLQVLFFSALAFAFLMRTRLYPPELRSLNLDADMLYRRVGDAALAFATGPVQRVLGRVSAFFNESIPAATASFLRNPPGAMRLLYDRMLLAWAGLTGGPQAWERARQRVDADRVRFEQAPSGAAWPVGTTVLYASVVFLVVLVAYLL